MFQRTRELAGLSGPGLSFGDDDCQGLDQFEELPAEVFRGDLVVGSDQLESLAPGHGVTLEMEGLLFLVRPAAALARRRSSRNLIGDVLEEVIDRHIEDPREVEEAAAADPVRAPFVFLDLLESHAEGLAQLLLGHAE